jgi:tetratricopeptide (TPR) repeat protein
MSDPIHCPDCGAELPAGQFDKGLCPEGALDLERAIRWRRRKPVSASLAATVALAALVGLAGWVFAQENGSGARDSDRKRLEILHPSDALLAERALTDTNLSNSTDLLRGLQEAIDRQPTNAVLWRSRAVVLERVGIPDVALAHFSRAIELASTNNEKPLLTDALLRRSELLRDLNRGAEAGMDERRALGLPYKHIPTNALPDYQRAAQVSVEFGATNRESGLYVVEVGDSKHAPAIVDEQPAWYFNGGWNYCYFFIDPTFKWKLGSDVVVRAEYQIFGRNPMGVEYDSVRGAYAKTTDVQREYQEPDSNWRVIEFRIRDARFRNSQNGHADFRIYDNEKGFCLRRITLTRYLGRRIRPRDPSTSSNLVDLTAYYNASLRLYMPGGDPDAATNVLQAVRQTTGVDFDARGYIGLYRRGEESTGTNTSPVSVTGIPIGRRLSGLHFLQAASYGETTGQQIGSYVMHMSDGSRQEFAIVYGRNVCSERGDNRNLPEAEVAWQGEGIRTGAGTRVRMFKVTWVNPDPALAVTSVDFVSTRSKSAPHLIAITIEP